MRVTVWNEAAQQIENESIAKVYPKGLNPAIAEFIAKEKDFSVTESTLNDADCGLSEELLQNTDVLVWWGHRAHHLVSDEAVKRVCEHVLKGMGILFLHSSHLAKPFVALMGTSCTLGWSEKDFSERIFTVNPSHPIAAGIPLNFKIPGEEMYCEPFDIPAPDELVFIGGFSNSAIFRAGCCYKRGYGNVFYFQPGHETYPVYYQPEIQKIITNAVRWAYSPTHRKEIACEHVVE